MKRASSDVRLRSSRGIAKLFPRPASLLPLEKASTYFDFLLERQRRGGTRGRRRTGPGSKHTRLFRLHPTRFCFFCFVCFSLFLFRTRNTCANSFPVKEVRDGRDEPLVWFTYLTGMSGHDKDESRHETMDQVSECERGWFMGGVAIHRKPYLPAFAYVAVGVTSLSNPRT
ncbi:uncharacterized protein LY79DRAFT_288999 [Colletotrichum navitas]|uniref:Uncharacterized protein n=1 Tax=Colletotrichum navitas TaxID=681940 RepID=A0AAD8PU87_9PEZI|nr:uncharacterized protein LY79DRAFT_288999 [Colletotrichum navitas]KAK1584822.1 hypothetical protein LY79DRAFT_288999 [Colletotrichum navitas]